MHSSWCLSIIYWSYDHVPWHMSNGERNCVQWGAQSQQHFYWLQHGTYIYQKIIASYVHAWNMSTKKIKFPVYPHKWSNAKVWRLDAWKLSVNWLNSMHAILTLKTAAYIIKIIRCMYLPAKGYCTDRGGSAPAMRWRYHKVTHQKAAAFACWCLGEGMWSEERRGPGRTDTHQP